jgi:iron(III) transport system substrate-binding protein
MKSVTISTLLSLFFVFSLITGCSKGEEINIYSSRHYDTDLELYDEFTKETGIRINLIEGGSDELIERIKSEGINSPADVVITVDAGRLWRAKEAGVLSAVESDMLFERIPVELRDVDNQWFGLSQRIRGIVYNKSKVSEDDLQGYLQLADPAWNGRICVRSSNNIYNQSMVASLIESIGEEATEEWATALVSNFARSPQGGDTDQIKAVAAGVCDVALANHYYLARLIDSEDSSDREVADAVGIYFPGGEYNGVHVNISGAGVAANAPNRTNAIRFLEYLTEENAQAYFSGGNYEYPVSGNSDLPEILDLFGSFTSDAVNVSAYGRNNPDAIRLMDRAGWR